MKNNSKRKTRILFETTPHPTHQLSPCFLQRAFFRWVNRQGPLSKPPSLFMYVIFFWKLPMKHFSSAACNHAGDWVVIEVQKEQSQALESSFFICMIKRKEKEKNGIAQWISEFLHWARSVSHSWEFIRNAESQVLLPDLLNQHLWEGRLNLCFNKPSQVIPR